MLRANTKTYYNTKTEVNRVGSTVNNYNNSKHSVIKMKPNEAVKPENEKKVRENIYKYYLKKNTKLSKREDFKVGDFVRYFIKKDLFSKDYQPNYSKEILQVVEVPSFAGKPTSTDDYYIKLDNEAQFLPNELLKVNPPKNYKQSKVVEKYSAGTEKQLKELAKSSTYDDGINKKLKEKNKFDLLEKKEERSHREKKVPKKYQQI